jgi:hypothetical protein
MNGIVERFVITHKFKEGMRQLTFPQQARNTYATKEEAEKALEAFKGPEGLRKVLNAQEMSTLEVRAVPCYVTQDGPGDPTTCWFDD